MAFFFFLLLLSSIPPILPEPLLFQTLHVGPLPSPPPLEDDLFSSQLSSSSSSSSAPSLPLLHVDSLLPSNSTPHSLLLRRLRRDSARASSLLSSLVAAVNPSGLNASVVSGLPHGSGEYFARIGIGTPPSPSFLVLDTGSDVVWAQCSPCRRCYTQSDPLFNPRNSNSFRPIPCSSPLCHHLDASGCHPRRHSCLYQVSYGDGSSTSGDFSTDTFTFRRGARVPGIAFGCGHDNQGLFVAAAGLLGLGRGPLSFPSQASPRFRRRFSYCLVDRTSPPSSTPSPHRISSTAIFGDTAVPRSGVAVAYTPMLSNPKLDTFYYVELTGMSVGGRRVAGVRASDLKLDPATGRGGVIVDSGTSVTRLTRPSYEALRDAFKAGMSRLKGAPGFSLFDTCFDLSGREVVKVPTVAMHLRGTAGGATEVEVRLPAENYMIPVNEDGVFCFAFAGTDSGISIIGNIQQQGFRVVFDGETGRVGFKPGGC